MPPRQNGSAPIDPGTPCPSQPQQGDFVSTARGSVLEIVDAPTLTRHGTAQPHQRQGNTARLYPLGPTVRVTKEQARALKQVPVRHRLLPTTGEAEVAALEADPLSPDAWHPRLAAALPLGRAACGRRCGAARRQSEPVLARRHQLRP